MDRLILVMLLTAFIHLIITLHYAIRLAGLRTGRLFTAISIFNVIYLAANVSNVIQAPLLTSIIEQAIKVGSMHAGGFIPGDQLINQEAYREQLILLDYKIRLVILSASIGSITGLFWVPAVVRVFIRAIHIFEEAGSIPIMFLKLVMTLPWRRLGAAWPRCSSLIILIKKKPIISKKILLTNIIVTGFYTTGVLSSLYAAVLLPDFRSTATSLSAIINGLAVIIGAVVIDPVLSSITDQALCGLRSEMDIKQMTFYMAITRLLGTVFAQAIFLPCSYFIKYLAGLLS